jgi:hypothetical protein
VSNSFSGLDTTRYKYALSVEVYATDFQDASEYVDGIFAGGSILSSNCNPGVDGGGFYFSCVSSQDVTADVSGGSLLVKATATSQINCCAYNGYYLYVRYTLSPYVLSLHVPTGAPSFAPSLYPSASPTGERDMWEGGTNSPLVGVSHTFSGLDTASYTYSLTVEVYATDFGFASEYVDGIFAGASLLSSNCDPGVDSGGYYFDCVSSEDVTADVSGGSLLVKATATLDVNCCSYNGYFL